MKYIFTLIFYIVSVCCFAQQKDSLQKSIGHTPLFLLDNIRIDSIHLKEIDANNIATVTVLKDKNATALFGKEGEYGVVLITSKNAVKKYQDFLKSQSDDYAEDFPAPFSDSVAQYILNDCLVKYPTVTLLQLNAGNIQNIRIIGKAELIRNYNVNNKQFGVKIKAENVMLMPIYKK